MLAKAARTRRSGPPGLIGYWPYDFGSLHDASGSGMHAAYFGTGLYVVPSKYGYALDGSAAAVMAKVEGAAAARLVTPARTQMCWAYCRSVSPAYQTMFGMRENGTPTYVFSFFIKSTGKLACYLFANAMVNYDGTGVATIALNTWYHYALTYDSTNGLKAYLNGVLDGSAAANGPLVTTSTQPAEFAFDHQSVDAAYTARFFNGRTADMRIYNRALRQDEIQAVMNDFPRRSVPALGNGLTQIYQRVYTSETPAFTAPLRYQLMSYLPYGQASATPNLMRSTPSDPSWPGRMAGSILSAGGGKAVSGVTKSGGVLVKRRVVILTQPPGSQVIFETVTDKPLGAFTFPTLAPGKYVVLDCTLDGSEQALVYDWVVAV